MPIFIMRRFSFRLNLPPAGLGTTEGGFVWSSAGLNASPPRWGGQRVRAERGVRVEGTTSREFVLRLPRFRSEVRSFEGGWEVKREVRFAKGSVLVLWLRREHCARLTKTEVGFRSMLVLF
ncbi:MAG: hypothetical protein ACTS4X_01460 [Candidatus Hodgkinia cicadicola]